MPGLTVRPGPFGYAQEILAEGSWFDKLSTKDLTLNCLSLNE